MNSDKLKADINLVQASTKQRIRRGEQNGKSMCIWPDRSDERG